MRKFLTALLAVMMIVTALAVVPTSAATTWNQKSAFDGTTPDNVPKGLIVTEIMVNSTTDVVGHDANDSDYSLWDAYEYVEVYNASNSAIDLYSLCILGAKDKGDSSEWKTNQKFTHKMVLRAGDIFNGVNKLTDAQKTYECVNPASASLAPGKFAIIWFWNGDCVKLSATEENGGESIGATKKVNGKDVYHYRFREHYKKENSANADYIDDALIVAVCADAANNDSNMQRFNLSNGDAWMYAIADKGFDHMSELPFTKSGSSYTQSSKIKCMFGWGIRTKVGIPTSDGMDGLSTVYVPASCTPDLYNRAQKFGDSKFVDCTDYVEIGYTLSYKEMAILTYAELPTPGHMSDFQWAYVAPTKAPTSVTGGNSNWVTTVLKSFVETYVEEPPELEDNPEEEREVILKDRDELGNQGQNKPKPTTTNEEGFPIWAIILIAVGALVVVGGGALVVIVIIKKKNRPVAADDVATDGEVEVVDEDEGDVEIEEIEE